MTFLAHATNNALHDINDFYLGVYGLIRDVHVNGGVMPLSYGERFTRNQGKRDIYLITNMVTSAIPESMGLDLNRVIVKRLGQDTIAHDIRSALDAIFKIKRITQGRRFILAPDIVHLIYLAEIHRVHQEFKDALANCFEDD